MNLIYLKYVLQTFTESRTTAYACEPYHGSPIYITGQPLQPWDIPCVSKILFNNEVHKIEIPNTAHVEVKQNYFSFKTKLYCNIIYLFQHKAHYKQLISI